MYKTILKKENNFIYTENDNESDTRIKKKQTTYNAKQAKSTNIYLKNKSSNILKSKSILLYIKFP